MRRVIFILSLLCGMASTEVHAAADNSWKDVSVNELFLKGYSYITEENNPDSALYYFRAITNRHEDSSPMFMTSYDRAKVARSYNNIAFVYMYLKEDYQQALQNVIQAERFCNDDTTRVGLQLTLGALLSAYAICMPTAENQQLANQYYRSAFLQARQLGMTNEMLAAYMNLFTFGLSPDILQTNCNETNLMLHREYENTGMERYTMYFAKAADRLQHKQVEAALDDFRLQRRLMPLLDDPHLELFMERNMAEVFLNTQHYDSAFYHITALEQLARQIGVGDDVVAANELFSNYYELTGNKEMADHYALRYHQQRDSLFQSRHLSMLASSGLLEKLNTTQGGRHRLLLVLVVGILATVSILFLLYRARRAKHKARTEAQADGTSASLPSENGDSTQKYQYSSLTERRKDDILHKVMEQMDNIDVISNPDFSIIMLANLCNSNHKYVSQVINERSGKSFSVLLAEKRVEEACRRMRNEEEYGNLTLESIGLSVGFKTRSGFLKAFKRVKGMPPSDYLHRSC